jgi:two-component system, chemotaxis family, sensor kinase CheA
LTADAGNHAAPDSSNSTASVGEPALGKSSSELHEDGLAEEERRSDGRSKEGRRDEDVARPSAAVDSNIRVGVGLLDTLMDLVGELVLTRNQILQFNVEREDPALNATSQRLNLITTELQEGVMKTRMQPIGVVWTKTKRLWECSRSSCVTRPRQPSCITKATPH